MNNIEKTIIETLNVLASNIKELEDQEFESKDFISINDFPNLIESYCKDAGIKKADICILAGISTTTLTNTLKNPLKASMSTINALSAVIGYQVLIGRAK